MAKIENIFSPKILPDIFNLKKGYQKYVCSLISIDKFTKKIELSIIHVIASTNLLTKK